MKLLPYKLHTYIRMYPKCKNASVIAMMVVINVSSWIGTYVYVAKFYSWNLPMDYTATYRYSSY